MFEAEKHTVTKKNIKERKYPQKRKRKYCDKLKFPLSFSSEKHVSKIKLDLKLNNKLPGLTNDKY